MNRGRPKGQAGKQKQIKSHGPLGDLIRKARLELKLGLSDVAKACNCSVQFISNIEHGRAPLPWDRAQVLAKVLKIGAEEVQTANLAIRADFKSFAGLSGKRVKKPEVLSNIANSMRIVANDAVLQEILNKYQAASSETKKRFAKEALNTLSKV